MTRPATVTDVLSLADGKLATGKITHTGCGYQVVWSLYLNRAQCVGCGTSWPRQDLETAKKNATLPRAGYLHWVPPMEIENEQV